MLLAAIDSFGYRVFYLIHIAAIIVAFAPAFVWPIVTARARKSGESLGPLVGGAIRDNWTRIHGPSLGVAGLAGIVLILLSDDVFGFSQVWISIAFVLWFLMLGVVFGLLPWSDRKAAEGDEGAASRSSAFTGMLHLLLVLQLVVMIWKPGL